MVELIMLALAVVVYFAISAARFERRVESGHDRAERREYNWHYFRR